MLAFLLFSQRVENPALAENNLVGQILPDMKIYSEKLFAATTLHSICDKAHTGSIIAFFDRALINSHVQQTVFERFAQNNQDKNYQFSIVYLCKQPVKFLKYLCPARPSPCKQFAVKRKLFEKEIINPGDSFLIMYINRNHQIINCCTTYCNYEKLQFDFDQFQRDNKSSGGNLR
ncbi:hypothetical protein K8T06_08990 [bacterium]|nr:hypothetical protein [bacterium]